MTEVQIHGPTKDAYHERELGGTWVTCRYCPAFRVNDWHYFYCRLLGDHTKPDKPYTGGWVRLFDTVYSREAGELAPCEIKPRIRVKAASSPMEME